MSGYLARNPLMTDEPQFGPPPVVAGRPILPNALAMPAGDWRDTIAPQPTQAEAADATAKAYTDWQARDRAEQIRLGHVDPATGQLTPQGWRQQAQIVAGGFGPADVGMAGGMLAGIKGYHASPQAGLVAVHANPSARQFDNATSQLGGFFATTEGGAARYGEHRYTGELPDKLYEMPYRDFAYFQNIHKGPNGETLPGEQWAARAEQLKQEAAALRAKLQEQGYGGVQVRTPKGAIAEMSSFSDVPVQPVAPPQGQQQGTMRPSIAENGMIRVGDNVVGRIKYEHGDGSTRIADITIDPSFQNQGIGSDVIRQIQDEAAARGNPVVLSTDAFRGPQAQANQRRLYERLGFQPNTGPGAVSETIGRKKVAEELAWHPPKDQSQ